MAKNSLSLVVVEQNNPTEPLADSRAVARELKLIHTYWIKNIVQKYQEEIEENFGVIGFKKTKPNLSGGRPERYCLLTEEQVLFCLTLSRNSPRVIELKARLVTEFTRLKKKALEAQVEIELRNRLPAWQEERKQTKLANKRLSDAVYEFSQTTMMSHRRRNNMYSVVSTASSIALVGCAPWIYKKQKMVNSFRDALDSDQLRHLELLENLAAHLISNQNVQPKNAVEQAALMLNPAVE